MVEDIPGMHRVRLAVRENRLTSDRIRPEHYVPEISVTGRGWVVERDGVIVAFAIGNFVTGNIWALFVDPGLEGRGYGGLCFWRQRGASRTAQFDAGGCGR